MKKAVRWDVIFFPVSGIKHNIKRDINFVQYCGLFKCLENRALVTFSRYLCALNGHGHAHGHIAYPVALKNRLKICGSRFRTSPRFYFLSNLWNSINAFCWVNVIDMRFF